MQRKLWDGHNFLLGTFLHLDAACQRSAVKLFDNDSEDSGSVSNEKNGSAKRGGML